MTLINLIPPEVLVLRRRRYRTKRWAIAVLAAVAAVAVSAAVEWYRHTEAGELRAQSDRMIAGLGTVRAEVVRLTGEVQSVRRQRERSAALRSKRAWSGLFATIGVCLPKSCWLVSISTDPSAPGTGSRGPNALRPVTTSGGSSILIDAPRKLTLVGYAPDAADPHAFVTQLKGTNLFAHVGLERSQRESLSDRSYYRFELVCEW